jgi:hypothetical protein
MLRIYRGYAEDTWSNDVGNYVRGSRGIGERSRVICCTLYFKKNLGHRK